MSDLEEVALAVDRVREAVDAGTDQLADIDESLMAIALLVSCPCRAKSHLCKGCVSLRAKIEAELVRFKPGEPEGGAL